MPEAVPAESATVATLPGVEESVEAVLERVFITPRVVDQRAFEDFATNLKGLVRDAAVHSHTLGAASAEVKLLGDQVKSASRELREHLAAAGAKAPGPAAVPAIDERTVARLVKEQVTLALRDWMTSPRAAPAASDPANAAAITDAQQRVVGVLEKVVRAQKALDGSTRAVEERLAAATSRGEELLERLAVASATLDRLADQAVVRVAALAEQIEAARARAEATQRALDDSAQAAEVREAAVKADAERAVGLAASAARDLDESATLAGARLGAAITQAERRAAATTTGTEAMLADFERRAGEIARRAGEGVTPPAAPDATAEAKRVGDALAALVAQANAVGAGLDRLLREAKARDQRGG